MKTYRFAKLASAIMAGLALSIALAPARAEKIDFDQGVDASQVLKDIQRQIPLEPIDNAVVIPALSATKEPDFVVTGAVIGMDLLARMEQSEPYRTAAQYPPLIEDLPPEVRDPLKAEWASISTLWAGLTSEANGLEAEDDRLYARAEALDRNAERLERKAQVLKGDIDNFNRQCVGRPLPPDEYQACLRWRDDLQQRIRAHNAEVEQHNDAVNQWRSEVTDLRRRAGTESANGKQKASPWLPRVMGAEGQRLIPFSNAAKKALEERGCGRLTGLKIHPVAPPDLPTRSIQRFTATASFGPPEDKPCPVTYLWMTRNSVGNIGRLEVQSNQKSADLITGNNEAKGLVVVEADEVIGKNTRFQAEAHVTVKDLGNVFCGLLPNQSHPDVPNICAYECGDGSSLRGSLDQFGEADPANPGRIRCKNTIPKP